VTVHKRLALVAAVAAFLVAGAALAAKTVTIGPSANGKTVHLQEGDTLRVSLRGNPSTGYTWQVAKVDRTVLKPALYSTFKADARRPGAGGTETRRFTALKAGTTRLKLVEKQSGSGRVAKTFLVTVAVG
jgi:inhibitor of cysteine peptidase